jgi:hypothetical protein
VEIFYYYVVAVDLKVRLYLIAGFGEFYIFARLVGIVALDFYERVDIGQLIGPFNLPLLC